MYNVTSASVYYSLGTNYRIRNLVYEFQASKRTQCNLHVLVLVFNYLEKSSLKSAPSLSEGSRGIHNCIVIICST